VAAVPPHDHPGALRLRLCGKDMDLSLRPVLMVETGPGLSPTFHALCVVP
jgi:hypothetical protein